MIHRTKYDPNADIEALQTDIMRFMAILGFCLMAIFSLVQSIPTGKADPRPRLELKAPLEVQLETLKSAIQALQEKRDQSQQAYETVLAKQDRVIKNLQHTEQAALQTEQRVQTLALQARQLEQEAKQTRTQLTQQLAHLNQIESSLSAKQQVVEQLATVLSTSHDQLTMVRQKVSRETLSLNTLSQQIDFADDTLQQVEQRLADKRHQQAQAKLALQQLQAQQSQAASAIAKLTQAQQQRAEQKKRVQQQRIAQQKLLAKQAQIAQAKQAAKTSAAKAAKAAKKKTAQVTPPSNPQKVGFSLRFGSDRVLTTLVKQGLVDFFAMTKGSTFRIYQGHFTKAEKPRQFHQMTVDTVPSRYQRLLQQKYTFYNANTITWGVSLPGRLQRKIQTLTSQHPGGDIVIQAGGEVILE